MLARSALSIVLLAATSGLAACHEVHFEPRTGKGDIIIFDDLFSVAPVGDRHVVAAGYWGAVYVSDDAGATWIKSNTGTKSLIYDVSMATEQKGWAVGMVGLILRTEDGGLTWTKQPNMKADQGVHLFSVQALDENRAWAVGEWGTRIYTDDGGKTWQDRSLTIDEAHPQFVWLSIPDQERVRRGEPVFEDVGLNDVYCLPRDTRYCWMIGEFGYVFHSENGGEEWDRGEILSGIQVDPLQLGYDEIRISEEQRQKIIDFAKQIADQQHLNVAIEPRVSDREIKEFGKEDDPFPLFEIIEARTQEVVAAVEEAGILQDRIRRRGAPPWDYEDFLEDDPDFLKRYIESRRAETPSIEVEIAQNPYLFTIRFADPQEGYISGLGGVVLRSHDGGESWHYEEIGRKQALFAVEPLGDDRSIVVGEKGLARMSTDGGIHWAPIPQFPTIFTFMRDVTFNRERTVGYIVGQRGLVLRSEDGGTSWTQVLPQQQEGGAAPADLADAR